jgi:hypothetical protein
MGTNVPVPLMAGMNHGTIIAKPTDELVSLVKKALLVVMALSGSAWIDFQGFGWEAEGAQLASPAVNERWDAMFDLTQVLERDRRLLDDIRSGGLKFDNQRLFAPFTTTLVEIRLDRDAYPLDLAQISNLFGWAWLGHLAWISHRGARRSCRRVHARSRPHANFPPRPACGESNCFYGGGRPVGPRQDGRGAPPRCARLRS